MAATVRIDPDLCIGTGDCVRLSPESFVLDESLGVTVPLPGARTAPLHVLELAANGCPTSAITVEPDDHEPGGAR